MDKIDLETELFWQALRDRYYEIVEGAPLTDNELRNLVRTIQSEVRQRDSAFNEQDERNLDEAMSLFAERSEESKRRLSEEHSRLDVASGSAQPTYQIPALFMATNDGKQDKDVICASMEELVDVLQQCRRDTKFDINEYDIGLHSEIARFEAETPATKPKKFKFKEFGRRVRRIIVKMLRSMFCF